ncbi:MAG: hypothetical protein RL531_1834 [Actinomycetota bacterium]|jgi:hypothetical protein
MTEGRVGPLALARAAAAATPPNRDRVVDVLRAGSLLVVVLGHVLMAYVTWDDGRPRLGNLLAELPALKILTWLLQVMPLFFAAGQIANAGSYAASRAAGSPWRVWYWGRVRRLARPALYYLAIWIPIALGLEAALPRAAGPLARLSTQLLWFLGVYVLVVALTGTIERLAARGWPAVLGLLAVITIVDLGRFHLTGGIGVLNFLLVWVLAATLGPIVRARAGSPHLLLVALTAVVANAFVVRVGPYPLSLVGMPGEPISNMAPPTLVLALHAVWLVALIGWAWPYLDRWCHRPRAWVATCLMGGLAMTVYLWHLTALILLTVVEHVLDLDRPAPGSVWFWPATSLHVLAFLGLTVGVVLLAAPLEHRPIPWLERPTTGTGRWRDVVGVVSVPVLAIGFLVISLTGMQGFPNHVREYVGIPWTPAIALGILGSGVLLARVGGAVPSERAIPARR